LLDPEWTLVYLGDLNRDGERDAVGYKPASIEPDIGFQEEVQASYGGDLFLVSEAIVVQRTADGGSEVQLTISPVEVVAYTNEVSTTLISYFLQDPRTTPAGFFLGIEPRADAPLALLPYNAERAAFTQAALMYWDSIEQGWRLWPPEYNPAPPAEQVTPVIPPPTNVPTAPPPPPTFTDVPAAPATAEPAPATETTQPGSEVPPTVIPLDTPTTAPDGGATTYPAPAEPTQAPAEPTQAPAEPTQAPAEPTQVPVYPAPEPAPAEPEPAYPEP
jgi:hypothetical protein